MLEESAIVTACEGEIAIVETQRKTTCGGCEAGSTCGTSLLAKVFGNRKNSFHVRNPIDARPGERVIIGVPEASLPKASFVFYLVPLLAMMAGAVSGEWLAQQINFQSTEPMAIFCGLFGLLAGLLWVRYFSLSTSRQDQYQAVILRRTSDVNLVFRTHQQ
ncbi:MAG: SoxR reducing system RseC family protein [Candidatus Sedimenticola sp. 20ELBAFRAG]